MDPTRLAARAEKPDAGPVLRGVLAALSLGALVVGVRFDAVEVEDTLLVCAAGIAGFGVFSLVDSRRPVKEPPAIPAGGELIARDVRGRTTHLEQTAPSRR
jgi:hypothetical protein